MKKALYVLVGILFLSPTTSLAQVVSASATEAVTPSGASFSKDGIFGCSRNSATLPSSVGAFSAIGGVFVPVADYATELNTGVLVYQQCVLRGIVDRESEAATVANISRILQSSQTSGPNGGAVYPKNLNQDRTDRLKQDAVYYIQHKLGAPAALKNQIQRALVQNVQDTVEDSRSTIACPPADGRYDSRCDPLFAYAYADEDLSSYTSDGQSDMLFRLMINGGTYDTGTFDSNNDFIVSTPGFLAHDTISQAVTSGFRRTENANDVDQMVGALYSGLGTQILSSAQGLSGLFTGAGSQPSYMDQMSVDSKNGLVGALTSAAIAQLTGALQVETNFFNINNTIATTFTNAINSLRTAESNCYTQIISKVCAGGALDASNNCSTTDASSTVSRYHIATTTAYSQRVITANITPLATIYAGNIVSSQKAQAAINLLIKNVSQTTSQDAQRVALLQLDQLVTAHSLHTQQDVTTIQPAMQTVKDAMGSLVQGTLDKWGGKDTTDANNPAWCNYNDPAIIAQWARQWKQ